MKKLILIGLMFVLLSTFVNAVIFIPIGGYAPTDKPDAFGTDAGFATIINGSPINSTSSIVRVEYWLDFTADANGKLQFGCFNGTNHEFSIRSWADANISVPEVAAGSTFFAENITLIGCQIGDFVGYFQWITRMDFDARLNTGEVSSEFVNGLCEPACTTASSSAKREISLTYFASVPDTINISEPSIANGESFNRDTLNFNLTANLSRNTNCSLLINTTFNKSTNYTQGVVVNVSFNQTFADGHYTYLINCFDNVTSVNTSTNLFIIDLTTPIITDNFTNNTIIFNRNITGQFNFSDNIYLFSYNVSIEGVQIAGESNLSVNFFSFNLSYNLTGFSGGVKNLTVRIADGHTSKKLKENYTFDNGLLNDYSKYSFSGGGWIKTNIKGISLGTWSSEQKEDRYIQIYDPLIPSDTFTFIEESASPIYIINSNKENYKGTWIITDEHWKDYVLEGEPNSKVNIKRINDYKVEVTISNIVNNPGKLKFNSLGDLNIVTNTYSFTYVNATETFSTAVFRNISTDLTLHLDGLNDSVGGVILQWNDSNFTATKTFTNFTSSTYKVTLKPLQFINNFAQVNHTWFFNITTNQVTIVQPQIMYNILVERCSITNASFPIVNFSYFDEINNSLGITVENSYDLTFFDGSLYTQLTGSFSGNLSDAFCTNLHPSNVTYNWDFWNTLTLTKSGYVSKLIDIEEAFPLTASNNPYNNISLFMINISQSTTITFTWLTNSFEVIDGTMLIYICNPDGTRSLTDSTTIIGGEAVGNLELLTGVYSYEVIFNGIKFTSPEGYTKCHTESNTVRSFFVDTGVITITDELGLNNAGCQLEKIGNDTVNMSWGLNTEDTDTIIQGCISAYRQSSLGSQLIFENCSSSTVQQFSLVNSVPLNSFTYNIQGRLIQGSNVVLCADGVTFDNAEKLEVNFAEAALFGIFLLLVTLGLIYAGSPLLMLSSVTAGVIVVFIFGGFIFNSWTPIISIVLFITLIVLIGRYTRK